MGPDEVETLLRRLETLDGEDKIVCLPTRDRAFGRCVFPLPDEPADRAEPVPLDSKRDQP
jgi:hypothetical protein